MQEIHSEEFEEKLGKVSDLKRKGKPPSMLFDE